MKPIQKILIGAFTILLLTMCSKDNGASPILDVKQKNISFVQEGETKSIEITANNAWSVKIPTDANWLSFSKSNNELLLTTTLNNERGERETTITISSAGLEEKIKISQFGIDIKIIPSVEIIEMDYEEKVYEVTISSNTDYDVIIPEETNWVLLVDVPGTKSGLTDKTFYFRSVSNFSGRLRETNISFKQKDGDILTNVKVTQKYYIPEGGTVQGDEKITVKRVWASSEHTSQPIENAIDNDMSTIWHSQWGTSTWPISAIFYFEDVDAMDYIMYHPRTGHFNGLFKEFKLYVSYTENPDRNNSAHWELYGEYDFEASRSPSEVTFSPALNKPTAIKFEVLSGDGDNETGFASCAEMEFYKRASFNIDLSNFFADDIYSKVKDGISESDILKSDMPPFFKNLAISLLGGNYPSYHIQEYEAYRPITDLSKELKLSSYNQYENPTGIWLERNKEVYVFVGETNGERISLHSRNWTSEEISTYPLRKGVNVIQTSSTGQSYISYYTKNYTTAKNIKIHIAGGKINGYFDRNKNVAEDWSGILNNAAGDHLDIIGNYTSLIFHVPSLKANCPNDGMKLIELYDEIIDMEYKLMGFHKYNIVPKNRMLGRNMPTGYMHADGLGAAFNNSTMGTIGRPSVIVTGDNSWGIAHEFGHVNQIRPGLRWIGTVECTNNIYSAYVQYMLTTKYSTLSMRLEHESCRTIEGEDRVIGGRFNSHLHYGVLKGENWLLQHGQDGKGDHFVKLVPLWQLILYYKILGNKPDWFADVCEETRRTDDAQFTEGTHQINFIKRACKYTQTDLVEFFEKAGLLKPINTIIDDYGKKQLEITQAMCDEVKEYVKSNGWQKPEALLNYVSGNTINIYKDKKSVEGTVNQGVSGSGITRTVSHTAWRNVVAYETYANNELVRIAIAGTGTKDNSYTVVPYPTGATKIVAVSWDGKRSTVYQ